jgi:hypothetical protein
MCFILALNRSSSQISDRWIADDTNVPAIGSSFNSPLLSPLRFGGVTLIPRRGVWLTPGARLLCCKTARESTDINRETFVCPDTIGKGTCYLKRLVASLQICWLWIVGSKGCRRGIDNFDCVFVCLAIRYQLNSGTGYSWMLILAGLGRGRPCGLLILASDDRLLCMAICNEVVVACL